MIDWLLFTNAGFWVGTAVIIAAIVAIGWVAWITLTPEPDPPKLPVVHVEHPLGVEEPAPRHLRADADTDVVPRIPGATPRAGESIHASEPASPVRPYVGDLVWPRFAEERTEAMPVLRELPGPSLAELDALAGPRCPVCGGPGGCPCHIQAADCPLTTDTIRIDSHADTPLYVAAGGTQDLTAKARKAVEAA